MASDKNIKFTQEGYQKVQDDLERLKKEREEILVRLQTAREMGDLSENGAYKAARFELGSTDRQIRRLMNLLKFGEVVNTRQHGVVGFGSTVTITSKHGNQMFTVVDRFESDPSKQYISVGSPLGKAMLGKRPGDSFTVNAPVGETTYTIVDV